MNRRFSLRVFMALAVVALAAGCGSSDRPRDLSLDDMDPCKLISRWDLNALGVKAVPSPMSAVPGVNQDGSSCFYNPKAGGTVSVSVVTNYGIDRWTGGSMGSSKATALPRIQGYRTIQKISEVSMPIGPHDMCTLYVDVAGGQSLRAEAGPNQEDDPPSCDIARQYADAAMTTLVQQQE